MSVGDFDRRKERLKKTVLNRLNGLTNWLKTHLGTIECNN